MPDAKAVPTNKYFSNVLGVATSSQSGSTIQESKTVLPAPEFHEHVVNSHVNGYRRLGRRWFKRCCGKRMIRVVEIIQGECSKCDYLPQWEGREGSVCTVCRGVEIYDLQDTCTF